MNLEKTPEGQREFDVHVHHARQAEFYRRITQSIMGERPFQLALDLGSQEDEMYARLQELVEENLLSPYEAQEAYEQWWRVYGQS